MGITRLRNKPSLARIQNKSSLTNLRSAPSYQESEALNIDYSRNLTDAEYAESLTDTRYSLGFGIALMKNKNEAKKIIQRKRKEAKNNLIALDFAEKMLQHEDFQ